MFRWLRLIVKQLLQEIKHFKLDRAAIFSILVAIFAGWFTYRRVGREKFMSDFSASTFPYLQGLGAALAVMMVFLVVRSIYAVYEQAESRAVAAETRVSELSAKPLIDVLIREAFIIPKKDRVAECFVRLSLQNASPIRCLPTDYSLSLRVKGSDYDHTSPLQLNAYKLCYGKVQTMYDDEGSRYEAWGAVSSEGLRDINDGPTLISLGEPVEGWIAMAVHNVPEWEYSVESIGTYSHTEHDDEGNVIAEYPTDVCERVLHLTGVESLRVTVLDSFNQSWIKELSGPFESKTKRVLRRNTEPGEYVRDIFTQPRE